MQAYKREKIVELVHKWGNSTVDAVLDPLSIHFTVPEIEGFIAYRLESRCAVIFGDPVCSPLNIDRLVTSFHTYCEEQDNSIIYVIVSDKFAKWAVDKLGSASVEFGQELTVNPFKDDPRKGSGGRQLRQKVRRAIREGVVVEEYKNSDPQMEQAMESVASSWLGSRKGPQVYISHMQLFKEKEGKRWFYAKLGNNIIGTALLNRLDSREGWVLNRIILSPDAVVGTSEFLVLTVIDYLAKESCGYLSFGAVPTEKLGRIRGFKRFSSCMIYSMFHVAKRMFHLDGKQVFWEKFQPRGEPSHVLFGKSRIKIGDIKALIYALNMSF